MTDEPKNEAAEYWQTVQSIAEQAKEAEERGEDAGDYIHESVDGSYYVIYTHANATCLRETDNEDELFSQMGDDALAGCTSYGDVMARLAYWAMRADVDEAFSELPDAEEPSEDAEATA